MNYFPKALLIPAFAVAVFLFCTPAAIIQQGEGILELETGIEDRIALEEFGWLEAQLTLKNLSADTLFVPLPLMDKQPFFLIWSLREADNPLYSSRVPDIATYGQGLNNEHILQINAHSNREFVFYIPISEALLGSGKEIKPGIYSLKFSLENFYHGAKNKTFPMWFGRVESNVEVVEVY